MSGQTLKLSGPDLTQATSSRRSGALAQLRTGEALRAPALDPVTRWRVEAVRDVARQFSPMGEVVGACRWQQALA